MIRLAALAAASLAAALALLPQTTLAQTPEIPDGPVHATVESGVLAGFTRGPAAVFRNVPYAAPPVGPLRWAPPERPRPWSGERAAVFPGVSCPQVMNPDGKPNLGAATGPTSEDCLQLNVFAPKAAQTASKKAPVMVWLHGGGFNTGASWLYNGESFARDGVVFVAINYRLGALGFLAHPALTKAAGPDAPLGDYGLMDQIAALQWVKRNIAAFGGDPGNVTLLGESAGAMSTLALLTTPSAKGLFQKAVVESGGGWFPPTTLAAKEAEGVKLLQPLGVGADATADQLRALPAEKLAALQAQYMPFVDGRLLKETPTEAFARGHAMDVPLIIGSNSGEDSLLGPGPLSPEAVKRVSPAVRAAYPPTDDQTLVRDAFTDGFLGAPARWIAGKESGGKPAWLYYFSYIGARFRPQMTRAAHAAEIQYVLEYWGRRTPMSTVSDEDRAMAALMHSCWVAFAKTGTPACGTTPWPAYDPGTDQLMEFGSPTGVRTHFRKPQWDAVEAQAARDMARGE